MLAALVLYAGQGKPIIRLETESISVRRGAVLARVRLENYAGPTLPIYEVSAKTTLSVLFVDSSGRERVVDQGAVKGTVTDTNYNSYGVLRLGMGDSRSAAITVDIPRDLGPSGLMTVQYTSISARSALAQSRAHIRLTPIQRCTWPVLLTRDRGGYRVHSRFDEHLRDAHRLFRKGFELLISKQSEGRPLIILQGPEGTKTVVTRLQELESRVKLQGAGMALAFVRLRTRPETEALFSGPKWVEPSLRRAYPATAVRKSNNGYVIERTVVEYEDEVRFRVLRVLETVHSDGRYSSEIDAEITDGYLRRFAMYDIKIFGVGTS